MVNRYHRLDKVLNHRLSRERLYQQRAAICRRWLQAAQQRLDSLQQLSHQVRDSLSPRAIVRIQWHQDQQDYLRALQRRLARLKRLRRKLHQRLHDKDFQVVSAAQYRRATQTALARLEQEVNQNVRRNKDTEFHQLVQLKFLAQRVIHATVTRG